jgi:hypothetical protein
LCFQGERLLRKQRAPRRVRLSIIPIPPTAWNVRLAKIDETNVVKIRFGHLIWGFSIVFPNAWRLRVCVMLDHRKEPIDAEMQHCVINAAMPGRIRRTYQAKPVPA